MADKKDALNTFLLDYCLGGCAGAAVKTVMAPLSRCILSLRIRDVDPRVASGEVARADGLVAVFRALVREQGVCALWRGNLDQCLRYFPTQAVNLATKDQFKRLFPKYNPATDWPKFFTANLLSGGLAATTSLVLIYPLDQYRQHLFIAADCGLKPPAGFLAYCSDKVRGGGVPALYEGLGASIVGILAYRAMQLTFFDKIVSLNPYKGEQGWRGTLSQFAFSQLAMQCGVIVTYPLDTVRRRLQFEGALLAVADQSSGMVDCLRRILARDGVQGLYWGYGYNLLRTWVSHFVGQHYGRVSGQIIRSQGRDGKKQLIGGVTAAVLVGALFAGA